MVMPVFLDIHRVRALAAHLTFGQAAAGRISLSAECRFAVINVRDDRKIANVERWRVCHIRDLAVPAEKSQSRERLEQSRFSR